MRQCLKCTWRFADGIELCPECGSPRSFAIAGTTPPAKKGSTTRMTRAVPAQPAQQQQQPQGEAVAAPSGWSPQVPPAPEGWRPTVEPAAAAPAGAAPAAPGEWRPTATVRPDYDGTFFSSGIRVAGLALAIVSGVNLLVFGLLVGDTWGLIRALVLLIAGVMCCMHHPSAIDYARAACIGGLLLGLMVIVPLIGITGLYSLPVIAEIIHLNFLGICLYLLFHDGAPNLGPWKRALVACCVAYGLLLGGAIFTVYLVVGKFEKGMQQAMLKQNDEYVEELLKKDTRTVASFLLDADHQLGHLDHAASLQAARQLEDAGARDLRAAAIDGDAAWSIVLTMPKDQPKRDAVHKAIATLMHDDPSERDMGETKTAVDFGGFSRRHGANGEHEEE